MYQDITVYGRRMLLQCFVQHRKTRGKNSKGSQVVVEDNGIPPPPELPANEKAPWINITTSSFATDWGKMVNNSGQSDVEFITDGCSYYAHKLVLCLASDFFRRLFKVELKGKFESLAECPGWSKKQLNKITPDAINLGMVEGLESYATT